MISNLIQIIYSLFLNFGFYVDKRSKQVFFKPFLRNPLLYHYNLNLRHVGEERGIILISVIITEDRVCFGIYYTHVLLRGK